MKNKNLTRWNGKSAKTRVWLKNVIVFYISLNLMKLFTREMNCQSGTDSMLMYILIFYLIFNEIHMIEVKMAMNS